MLEGLPHIVHGMKVKTFSGLLNHKNPTCEQCGSHCYALYRGGKKEKMADLLFAKTATYSTLFLQRRSVSLRRYNHNDGSQDKTSHTS